MKLTSKGKYAIPALMDLVAHSNGRPVRLREISERQGISLHYLEQLFRKLRTGGIVKSVRGPGGGYILAKDIEEISVKDILDSVGETVSYFEKAAPDNMTPETESMRKFFGKTLENEVERLLATTTVQQLLPVKEEVSSLTESVE